MKQTNCRQARVHTLRETTAWYFERRKDNLSLSCHGVALGMCNRKPCVKKNFWVRQSLRNDFVPVCNAVVIHRVYRVFIVGVHTDYDGALHTYNVMVRFILCKESCVFVWVWVCNKDASLCMCVHMYVHVPVVPSTLELCAKLSLKLVTLYIFCLIEASLLSVQFPGWIIVTCGERIGLCNIT